MTDPINWRDIYYDSGERTILTYNEMGIPGLNMVGRHVLSKAISPLTLHYHQDAIEITYIAKGNAIFSVDDKEYKLSGGDVFIVKASETHSTGMIPISINKMYWMQLDVSLACDFLFLNNRWGKDLITALKNIENRVVKVDTKTTDSILDLFFNTIYNEGTAGRYASTSLLLVFLHMIIKRDQQISFNLSSDIVKATSYILENLAENITLEELAGISQLSLSRFKVKFKSQLGVTPREFINYHKVERAKELLQQGCSVTDTAMELNFSSSSYFSVVFKRFSTYSPTVYTKNLSDKLIDK